MTPDTAGTGTPGLRLGDPLNLLHGLRPDWARPGENGGPVISPPRRPFHTTEMLVAPGSAGDWGAPELTLHDDLNNLLDEIFHYRVIPLATDPDAFRVSESGLMLAGSNSGLVDLGARLGVDLGDADGGYLLAKMRRVSGVFQHEAEHGGIGRTRRIRTYWTDAGRNAMGRLRVAKREYRGPYRIGEVSARQARRYLAYFYDFGTHFVSKAEVGDLILQIFVCRRDRYRQLKAGFLREAGGHRAGDHLAGGLKVYTGPDWTVRRGRIVSASGDSALCGSIRAGEWRDAAGASLLSVCDRPPEEIARFCARFVRSVPVGVEFSAQSPFMEDFRANAWQRLLWGALRHKFPTCLEPVHPKSLDRRIAPPLADIRAPVQKDGDTIIVQGAALTPSTYSIPACDRDQALLVFCLHLDVPEGPPIRLPGRQVVLFAHAITAPCGPGAVLVLDDAAFGTFDVVTAKMRGAFSVTNVSGTRRETIADGVRFGDAPETDAQGIPRVSVLGDCRTFRLPVPGPLAGFLDVALDIAEAVILAPIAEPTETAEFARHYCNWLDDVLPTSPEWQGTRLRGLYLARILGSLIPAAPAQLTVPAAEAISDGLNRVAATTNRLLVLDRIANEPTRTAWNGTVEDVASVLHDEGNKIECILAEIWADARLGVVDPAEFATISARAEAALRGLRAVAGDVAASPAHTVAPAYQQAILAALASLLASDTPIIGTETLPQGEGPAARFWRLVRQIDHTGLALDGLEIMARAEIATAPDHVVRLFGSFGGPVCRPNCAAWSVLPPIAIGLLGGSGAPLVGLALEPALIEAAVAAQAWLDARIARLRSGETGFGSRSGSGARADPVLRGYWQLIRSLAHAIALQDAACGFAGIPARAALARLDLVSVVESVRRSQALLNARRQSGGG
jgi:hypothetical protein